MRKHHETDERVNATKYSPVEKEALQQGGSGSTQRYYSNQTNESRANDAEKLSDGQKTQLKSMLVKVEKMKRGHLEASTNNDGSVDKKNVEEVEVSIDEDEQTSDDEDSGPPILKRAKLGPLPSFIPI